MHLLPEKILRALTRKEQSEPIAAATTLARAKKLRETLFALVTRIDSGVSPPKTTLALLRQHSIAGINARQLHFDHRHVVAELRMMQPDFDLIAAMIAHRIVEHVLPLPMDRLPTYLGPNCSWLFIDRSKAGRRR